MHKWIIQILTWRLISIFIKHWCLISENFSIFTFYDVTELQVTHKLMKKGRLWSKRFQKRITSPYFFITELSIQKHHWLYHHSELLIFSLFVREWLQSYLSGKFPSTVILESSLYARCTPKASQMCLVFCFNHGITNLLPWSKTSQNKKQMADFSKHVMKPLSQHWFVLEHC